MTEQLVLFGEPELPPRFASFVRFHRANLVIYQKFVEFALEAVRAGREHFGARKGVFETRTATSDATDAMILRHCRTR
jgi:hypothetical protein